MIETTGREGVAAREPATLFSVLSGPVALLIALGLVCGWLLRPQPGPSRGRVVAPPAVQKEVEVVSPRPDPGPILVMGPPAPTFDAARVAGAENERDAASRRHAEAAAAELLTTRELDAARAELASRAEAARGADERLSVPRSRIARVSAKLAEMRNRRVGLEQVVVRLEGEPPPRKPLNDAARSTKSPVAREVQGEEYHFEVRGDRVAFIDLQRLLKLAEEDARLRMRMMGPSRNIEAKVGPVGSFKLKYELGRSPLGSLNELIEPGSGGVFTLIGFEIEPVQRSRGESFDVALRPASEFARVINRVRPGRSAITLWVYPDGFALYRRLTDFLSSRGYFVAARPLPEDVPVRGSPSGSRSAAQ